MLTPHAIFSKLGDPGHSLHTWASRDPANVKVLRTTGINPSAKVHDLFVKGSSEHGDPYREVEASRFLQHLGLPHLPIAHTPYPGYLYSPWTPHTTIWDDKEKLPFRRPASSVSTAVADYLIGDNDRHLRNFIVAHHDPDHVISIDHGNAFPTLAQDHNEVVNAAGFPRLGGFYDHLLADGDMEMGHIRSHPGLLDRAASFVPDVLPDAVREFHRRIEKLRAIHPQPSLYDLARVEAS